jgi:DNA repair exonuclease SbcCD ATPase subunit
MDGALKQLILDRLDAEAADASWIYHVMAACEGRDALEKALGGTSPKRPARKAKPTASEPATEPPGAYLRSITVEGFRGIGPRSTLALKPGPGLTLVVGRNGSGKSSFAEGLEFLLTGRNKRWEERPTAWKDGWRNLHHPTAALTAEFAVEGAGSATVTRTWAAAAELEASEAHWQPHGKTKKPLVDLGWDAALTAYRPFLPYSELGDLLTDKPAVLHDALSKVLGLGDLVDAQKLLQEARLTRQHQIQEVDECLNPLLTRLQQLLDESGDGRADAVLKALSGRKPDLAAASELVREGATVTADPIVNLLRQSQGIAAPSSAQVDYAARELLAADAEVTRVASTNAARARELASLLAQALTVHTHRDEPDCPVCGAADRLTPAWREATAKEVERLREEARAADQAHTRALEARRACERLLGGAPALVKRLTSEGVPDAAEALAAWTSWSEGVELQPARDLAAHMRETYQRLTEAVAALVDSIAQELRRREDRWAPIAQDVRAWIADARTAAAAKDQVNELKKAEKWLKDAQADIRSERFRPIADKARAVWQDLRQSSNVDLLDIQLTGTATQRRVALDVTVDGIEGAALGVMSQGELNALALCLFMPRASLPESPFRFMVIDDPVQSMDPARIDGLARALHAAAKARQVVVFTHDERLPQAVRYLGLPAHIVEVTRAPGSVVDTRLARTPVEGYLDDARTLVKTAELPDAVRRRVVPGFCRSALEAACMDTIRSRRLRKGESHVSVEELIAAHPTLNKLAALAIFDDGERAGDVMKRLNKIGPWARDAFRHCNSGAHDTHDGDLDELVYDSGRLARELAVFA